MNTTISLMAFGKVQESQEATEFKKYIGIAGCKVVAFNPSKKELSNLYGRDITKDPEYYGVMKDNDGKEIQMAYPTFILKSDPETNNGIEEFFQARFSIQNNIFTNKENTKCQVIDSYGRTAWATQDDVKNKTIPTYTDKETGEVKPFSISNNYRPAFRGEEALTMFLQNYLNIPSCQKYVNGSWVMIDNPQDAECRLDHITDYFKGNMSELKDCITLQPNNKVKVAIGVRTTDDGKQYSSVYTHFTMKNSSNSTSKLEADIQNRKNNGGLATTEFDYKTLHEYSVSETNFSAENKENPFAAPTNNPWANA